LTIVVQPATGLDDTEVLIGMDMKPRPCANPAYAGKAFGSNAAAWWGYHYKDLLTEPKPIDGKLLGRGSGEGFGVHICTGPVFVRGANCRTESAAGWSGLPPEPSDKNGGRTKDTKQDFLRQRT
jgi:hypothetical protein